MHTPPVLPFIINLLGPSLAAPVNPSLSAPTPFHTNIDRILGQRKSDTFRTGCTFTAEGRDYDNCPLVRAKKAVKLPAYKRHRSMPKGKGKENESESEVDIGVVVDELRDTRGFGTDSVRVMHF